jgi:ATP-dependent RNA helicase DeaD
VGRNHEARPGDIVGAIANEAGIESRFIGHIKLFDEFSTVDLPTGISKDVLQHLKKVRVRNRPLEISLDQGSGSASPSPRGGDREFPGRDKPRFKDKERDGGGGGRDFGSRNFSGKDKPRSKDGAGSGKPTSFRPKKTD